MRSALRRAATVLLAIRILVVAVLVPLLLRLDLARLERLLEPRRKPPQADHAQAGLLVARIERVLAAGFPLVRPGCLTRGVTLYYFLRRAGMDVRLVFGIGQPVADYEGHCWLVRDGEPYLERRDPRNVFRELYAIPH